MSDTKSYTVQMRGDDGAWTTVGHGPVPCGLENMAAKMPLLAAKNGRAIRVLDGEDVVAFAAGPQGVAS